MLCEYDEIIVDCPGGLEHTGTLAGVLASASSAVTRGRAVGRRGDREVGFDLAQLPLQRGDA